MVATNKEGQLKEPPGGIVTNALCSLAEGVASLFTQRGDSVHALRRNVSNRFC